MFDDATPVINGKAFVKTEGKWGVILVYGSAEEIVSDIDVFAENTTTSTTTTTTTTTTTFSVDDEVS